MTGLLVKLFVKNHEQAQLPEVRASYGKLSGMVGIVCNILLFGVKFLLGTLTSSVAITADAFNNLGDASSGIVSFFGFKMASRPADKEHPYGHARFEYLAALVVSILICVIGVEIFRSCLDKILKPVETDFGIVAVSILIGSVVMKLWMMFFARNIGKRINSKTLIATAMDSRNDVIATLAVLAGGIISRIYQINLDGYIGLGVALFILYSGFMLVKDTLDPLLGKAPEEELVNSIQDKILSYEGVLGTHDLLVHDYGPGRIFASVHIEMAAEEDVLKSHDIIDNIEREFYEQEGIHLIVHYDPIVTNDREVDDARSLIMNIVKEIHPTLSIHDLRIVPGPTHTNLIFDCVVPFEVEISHAEIKDKIKDSVKKIDAKYFCVITIDMSYAPIPQ